MMDTYTLPDDFWIPTHIVPYVILDEMEIAQDIKKWKKWKEEVALIRDEYLDYWSITCKSSISLIEQFKKHHNENLPETINIGRGAVTKGSMEYQFMHNIKSRGYDMKIAYFQNEMTNNQPIEKTKIQSNKIEWLGTPQELAELFIYLGSV